MPILCKGSRWFILWSFQLVFSGIGPPGCTCRAGCCNWFGWQRMLSLLAQGYFWKITLPYQTFLLRLGFSPIWRKKSASPLRFGCPGTEQSCFSGLWNTGTLAAHFFLQEKNPPRYTSRSAVPPQKLLCSHREQCLPILESADPPAAVLASWSPQSRGRLLRWMTCEYIPNQISFVARFLRYNGLFIPVNARNWGRGTTPLLGGRSWLPLWCSYHQSSRPTPP